MVVVSDISVVSASSEIMGMLHSASSYLAEEERVGAGGGGSWLRFA